MPKIKKPTKSIFKYANVIGKITEEKAEIPTKWKVSYI